VWRGQLNSFLFHTALHERLENQTASREYILRVKARQMCWDRNVLCLRIAQERIATAINHWLLRRLSRLIDRESARQQPSCAINLVLIAKHTQKHWRCRKNRDSFDGAYNLFLKSACAGANDSKIHILCNSALNYLSSNKHKACNRLCRTFCKIDKTSYFLQFIPITL